MGAYSFLPLYFVFVLIFYIYSFLQFYAAPVLLQWLGSDIQIETTVKKAIRLHSRSDKNITWMAEMCVRLARENGELCTGVELELEQKYFSGAKNGRAWLLLRKRNEDGGVLTGIFDSVMTGTLRVNDLRKKLN